MGGTNGSAALRVALYARVSTEEQAETGTSLRAQVRTLRDHAEREGWSVVGEPLVDDGFSGGDPYRPGWMRAVELARDGRIDAVAATKTDRFFRDEFYYYAALRQLEEYGVKMRALDATGNRIGDSVLVSFAAWEKERIRERLEDGLRTMIKEGGVKAGPKPPYGYRYAATNKALIVFEPEAEVVRTIYRMSAEGASRGKIREHLDAEGIASPTASPNGWNKNAVGNILKNPLYQPHGYDQVAERVGAEVAARLDKGGVYGLWRYNRTTTTKRKVWDEQERRFRDHHTYRKNGEESLLYVPVPDIGVPQEVAARVAENSTRTGRRWLPNADGSFAGRAFELRGMVVCPGCGSTLSPHSAGNGHYYYVCRRPYNNSRKDCPYRTHHRAVELERTVFDALRQYLDKREYFLDQFDRYAEGKRAELRNSLDAARARAAHDEMTRLERRRSGYLELAADGDMPREELRAKLAALEPQIKRLRESLLAVRDAERDAEALEQTLRRQRKQIEDASDRWINQRATPQDRAAMYRNLRLRVLPREDGGFLLQGTFGAIPVGDSTSTHSRR